VLARWPARRAQLCHRRCTSWSPGRSPPRCRPSSPTSPVTCESCCYALVPVSTYVQLTFSCLCRGLVVRSETAVRG